ncbi:MAG TPA: histidine kinase [Ferruginibacter sp.]|nr:histidine kinase [Ferruginibacter sp.]
MKLEIDIKRFWFYLLVGLAFLVVLTLSYIHRFPDTWEARGVNEIWRIAYIIILNYFLFEYTLRNFNRKRIFISILLLLGHIFLYSVGLYVWRAIGIQLHIYTSFINYKTRETAMEAQMSFSMSSIFFFGIIRHIYNHIKLKQATQRLRIEKQVAELNYLKSQTNPHFLFNTLNNIYSLARDKSDLAPESILRLSKILRFMLYETGGAFISIEQELKIITDYIALEKLRYDESLSVHFNHDIENMKQAVPPLLMIPLVENAFKHGVSETRGNPFVDIHLSVRNRQLMFIVKNSSEATGEVVKENIGLANLRRQLELLYTDYNLAVHQGESVFTSTLKINLASHV